MADLCCEYSVFGLTFNDAAPNDTYVITSIDGLDGIPIRRTVVNLPITDGGACFDAFAAPRHITIEGSLGIRSTDPYSDPTGYLTAMNLLETNLWITADANLNADSTLSWAPTGLGATFSLLVRRDESPV